MIYFSALLPVLYPTDAETLFAALAAHDGKAAAEAALRHVANARANIAGITQKGEN